MPSTIDLTSIFQTAINRQSVFTPKGVTLGSDYRIRPTDPSRAGVSYERRLDSLRVEESLARRSRDQTAELVRRLDVGRQNRRHVHLPDDGSIYHRTALEQRGGGAGLVFGIAERAGANLVRRLAIGADALACDAVTDTNGASGIPVKQAVIGAQV